MSLCKHCISGVTHEGTPTGKFEKIGGIDCYVATPAGDYPKDKVVLYLMDIFGIKLINHNLLADDYAKNGFKVVLPDILHGDPVPTEEMGGTSFDLQAWFQKHSPTTTLPVIDKVIDALKADGVTKFGVLGFCYGAKPAFHYAIQNTVAVTVVSHPSLLTIPDELEQYAKESKAPLLINSCEVDTLFPKESQEKADEVFGNGKFAPGYERTYWEGCTHGFSVRGDISDPKVKAGKEGAFKASVEFLIKHL